MRVRPNSILGNTESLPMIGETKDTHIKSGVQDNGTDGATPAHVCIKFARHTGGNRPNTLMSQRRVLRPVHLKDRALMWSQSKQGGGKA